MNETMLMELSKKKQRYIAIAKKLAEQSMYGTYKHGSVLVKGGSVINTAFNTDVTSSFAAKFRDKLYGRATKHAEVAAIYNINKSVTNGSTMYVVRVGKNGQLLMSKPCDMCVETLKYCGIKKVVYSTGEGFEICRF